MTGVIPIFETSSGKVAAGLALIPIGSYAFSFFRQIRQNRAFPLRPGLLAKFRPFLSYRSLRLNFRSQMIVHFGYSLVLHPLEE